jgi:hypothetical protein
MKTIRSIFLTILFLGICTYSKSDEPCAGCMKYYDLEGENQYLHYSIGQCSWNYTTFCGTDWECFVGYSTCWGVASCQIGGNCRLQMW